MTDASFRGVPTNSVSSIHFKIGYRTNTAKLLKLTPTSPLITYLSSVVKVKFTLVRGGAGKSLARPTSRCRWTESIVSLERGVCSCAELQVFPCYRGLKEACQATRAISTTWRRELSSRFFFLQDTEGNSCHSDRNIKGTCTIVCHRQNLGGPV